MDGFLESEWLDYIFDRYFVVIEPGQVYVQNYRVYAGSEYVASLGSSMHPQDATDWTPQINHFPRGLRRMETALDSEATVYCRCGAHVKGTACLIGAAS